MVPKPPEARGGSQDWGTPPAPLHFPAARPPGAPTLRFGSSRSSIPAPAASLRTGPRRGLGPCTAGPWGLRPGGLLWVEGEG